MLQTRFEIYQNPWYNARKESIQPKIIQAYIHMHLL